MSGTFHSSTLVFRCFESSHRSRPSPFVLISLTERGAVQKRWTKTRITVALVSVVALLGPGIAIAVALGQHLQRKQDRPSSLAGALVVLAL